MRRPRDTGIAKLSAVGIRMPSHSGVAATMFKALADAGINIGMIFTSEIKIAVIANEPRIEGAARSTRCAGSFQSKPLTDCDELPQQAFLLMLIEVQELSRTRNPLPVPKGT